MLDVTGFCEDITKDFLSIKILTGLEEGSVCRYKVENISSVVEIMSCPLFYRLKNTVSGSQDGVSDLKWERHEQQNLEEEKGPISPRMLLRCPEAEKYPRV